ncbi:N(2)-fixation sustaining protein CowN [Motiliproteus sediminis]|uniref:N(2)-fixation sustaining protein CowN n=1 Tax=Motiliproteus sediminis TaxID=1468178 RepID=UPI001AEFE35A|nr:N(2)-fixation sustaining protein CowN [Motiliproteus sediminis]
MTTPVESAAELDRYQSFCGLECEQRAEQLVAHVLELAAKRAPDNRFWTLFAAKANQPGGPDALFLVHSYVFYMRELLESHDDPHGLRLLDALERDCC